MKKLLLIGLSLACMMTANAQERAEKKEKMEAMKVAFITKELELTTEEAQKFWPVYNQREAELAAVRKEMHRPAKGKNIDEMNDAEIDKMMEEQIALRQKELDIEKSYHAKFKEVLSTKKVAKLYQAEHKFKREVMRQWKEKQGAEGGQKGTHKKEVSPKE